MKITLITVCFNSADLLRTALDSVLRQRNADYEYWVVDGGSADGTVELLKSYEPKFSGRMRWLSEPDDGMYDAINKGIRLASGGAVGILNADDFFDSDDVLAKVAAAFDGETEAVYSDIRFTAAGDALDQLRAAPTVRYYSAKRWRPWMLRWGYMPPHPGVYIRRECFDRLGFYKTNYHIAADYELLIRFLRRGGLRRKYLPLCSVGMRTGGKSTKNWRSNLLLNQEIVRGNRENGYICFLPMLVPKYVFKIWEFILPRLGRVSAR